MWWHATDWANLFKLVLQYALVLYVLAIQTITFCTSEKKEPSSKDVSKEDAQVMTTQAFICIRFPMKTGQHGMNFSLEGRTALNACVSAASAMRLAPSYIIETHAQETSPMASQGLDISLKTAYKATESRDQRGSAEDAGGATEKAPPKRVFPKRRKPNDPSEDTEVGTEHTIYERRAKVRQRDILEVEPTQRVLAHSPSAPKPEELAKALLKIQASEKKEKSMLDTMRQWFEEQVTQQQRRESARSDTQASSPRRRKSKRAPATLLPYQGTPVVHATPSERAARTAREARTTPKQEPSEPAGTNDLGNDNDVGAGEADNRDTLRKSLKVPGKKS
ncbi:hypothetical protein Y032_0053g2301 [Ancylostoma ceylanicum]|nr:hypothetical protein Y032_0053g2301 [Ancylostoma ceylanicum]